MKSILFFLFFSNVIAQDLRPYDLAKVVNEKELNLLLTNKRGIRYKEIVYYVQSDSSAITAYKKDGSVKWRSDVSKVIQSDKGLVAETSIRFIKIEKDKMLFVYGKHQQGKIELKTGKIIDLISD